MRVSRIFDRQAIRLTSPQPLSPTGMLWMARVFGQGEGLKNVRPMEMLTKLNRSIIGASILVLLLFTACVPTTPAPVGEPTTLPRLLATVYLSPTPEGGVVQVAAFQPTVTPSPTIAI